MLVIVIVIAMRMVVGVNHPIGMRVGVTVLGFARMLGKLLRLVAFGLGRFQPHFEFIKHAASP